MAQNTSIRRKKLPAVDPGSMILLSIMAVFLIIGLIIFCSLRAAQLLTGYPTISIPINPFELLLLLSQGKIEWTTVATGFAVLTTMVIVVIALTFAALFRAPKTPAKVDNIRHLLADKQDRSSFSKKVAIEKSTKWFPDAANTPGLMFGWAPGSNRKTEYYSTWEDLYLIIFGPRRGKTTSQVIPAIVDAPGNVLTTSNKRDIVDDTVALTSARGSVYVFDPQNIAAGFEQPAWFFDPLDSIRRDPLTADAAAGKLADIFAASAADGEHSSGDTFFSNSGRDLLSRMLLAAALDNRPISDVFIWANDDQDRSPISILSKYPEWEQLASALAATYAITERTRSGIFSHVAQLVAPLGRRAAVQWVTPKAGAQRFKADEFVRAKSDTLYLLSKEGADNAAALTTALTAAVMEAAERYGEECGGRLPVPLVAPLDEAANVVKWPELPRLYSHYGSRSIILMTILQSYAQGVSVWGEQGMEALWSASAILIYGGGVRDERMLQKMEGLIGEAQEVSRSSSRSRDGRNVSYQMQEKKILTVAELASLEADRAIVFATARRPLLIELPYFWLRHWPEDIRTKLNIKS